MAFIPKRILFLDDVRDPEQVLGELSCSLNEVWVLRNAHDALHAVITEPRFDCWQLDHDLGMEIKGPSGAIVSASEKDAPTGYDFLKLVVDACPEKWPAGQIRVHSANPVGAENMRNYIEFVERHRQKPA